MTLTLEVFVDILATHKSAILYCAFFGKSIANMVPKQRVEFQPRITVDFAEVRKKLRSEHGPAVNSESDSISRILEDIEKDLGDYDAEVHRLQSRIVVLRNQRRRLEKYKTWMSSFRSPTRLLPNETLLHIFDYACDVNELTSKDLRKMPTLSISGVCGRWRGLAISRPDLWSRICFKPGTDTRHWPSFPILQLYLDSSHQSPLSIEIPDSSALEPHHLSTIRACSGRWQKLEVKLSDFKALTSQAPLHLSELEELMLPNIALGHLSRLDYFQDAPKLCRLTLGKVPLVNMHEHCFPWKQLTMLNIAQFGPDMKGVFELCSNLTELHLCHRAASQIDSCVPPIIAPVVKRLVLSFWQSSSEPSEADIIFASITCPSLTSLLVDGVTDAHALPKDEVDAFIARSSSHLTTLSLKSIMFSDLNLINLLHRIPSLLHLKIDDSGVQSGHSPITSHLVQSLHAFPYTTSATISSALVTGLQTLSLTLSSSDSDAQNFSDSDFVDMVCSRWYPDVVGTHGDPGNSESETACLRSVVMRCMQRALDEEIYRPLKHLEEAGMMVVVVGENSFVSTQ